MSKIYNELIPGFKHGSYIIVTPSSLHIWVLDHLASSGKGVEIAKGVM